MNRLQRIGLVLGLLAIATLGLAATKPTGVKWLEWYQKGVFIGLTSNQSDNNMVTGAWGAATATVDIGTTAGGACTNSHPIAITGVKTGDPCTLGMPAAWVANDDGGPSNGTWSCYASAADVGRVRFCNPSPYNVDPADAGGFGLRFISNQ